MGIAQGQLCNLDSGVNHCHLNSIKHGRDFCKDPQALACLSAYWKKKLHIWKLFSISGVDFLLCLSIFNTFQLTGCHRSDNAPAHPEGTNVLQHWVTKWLIKLQIFCSDYFDFECILLWMNTKKQNQTKNPN